MADPMMSVGVADVVAALVLGCFCLIWFTHIIALIYGRYKLHRPPPAAFLMKTEVPGVSILKPLTGTDPNLRSNLETFFKLDYPQFEILFCVQDDGDPVLDLLQQLKKEFPSVPCQIFVGGERVGINPKINNLMPGYRASKFPLIWVCDSGIRVSRDTLSDMAGHMTDNVGVVHQMPYVCDRKGFSSLLEKVYFGTAHARMYTSANVLGILCVTGMSSLWSKKVIDDAGGLEVFSQYLAEDYFMAKAVVDRGLKASMSNQVAQQNCGTYSIRAFSSRMSRWTQLRVTMIPFLAMWEPFTECFLLGLICSWAFNHLFLWDPVTYFIFHVTAWMISDYLQFRTCQMMGATSVNKFEFLIAWLLRETLTYWWFLRGATSRSIKWKTGKFRLRCGGTAEEV
ncbi:ceramide glucosyltransferase-like [Branchiostoma lanceolatum]|uniref:ceramide glucosyltransferase-like n=1 Tax=Branchiostoma lanceolatum TaxID=7740 RepID=UPI003452319D